MDFNSMTLDQKFAKVLIELRTIRPFYSAIYESIEHVEVDKEFCETMAVSESKLYYNKEFVESLPYGQLLFTVLHELGHIALMHVSRLEKRDRDIWNIACDLYVNKMLAEEFDIDPSNHASGHVEWLQGCLYCSSVNLEKDFVEDMYESIFKQVNNQSQQGNSNGQGQGQQGSSGSGQQQQGQQQQGQQQQGQQQQGQQQQGQQQGNGPTDLGHGIKKYDYTFKGSGDDNKQNDKYSEFNGSIIDVPRDVLISNKDQAESDNESRRVLTNADTKYELSGNKGIGNEKGGLHFMVKELLSSHLNWVKLLNKYCENMMSTDVSFVKPDKRMFYQSAIYPGQSLDDENMLRGVKICFDTSGSISSEDLGHFLGQIKQLMKRYKLLDCDVICWDCGIESITKLNETTTVKELNGRGGTNPKGVFDYFKTKACKVKPKVILMFTDGFIDVDDLKACKKYKDTIWVLTKNCNKMFEPPFGKIALAKFGK